tara:strand:- start:25 stop:510 length:486 start_codon:yes stop_codon:yes gene_type:complete
MTLGDLGNIGEFIGSVGVIVSLVYVGLQLKMTRQSERATSAWQSEKTWADLNWELTKEPALARLTAQLLNGESIEESETAQTNYFVRTVMQHAQSQYYLNKEGILPDEIWVPRLNWLRQFVSVPTVASIVANERTQKIFSEEFWVKIMEREEQFNIPVGRK